MSGSMQTKHTVPCFPAHSLVLMRANESHHLCISMLLCTEGLVWDSRSMWEGLYSCSIPVFGLVLELSHHCGPIYQLTAQNMLSDVLSECWHFVPLESHCEV